MDPRIAEWLASGDTGTSSKSIMLWFSAGVTDKMWGASTPSDLNDLARCSRLLDRIPEWRERMTEMAEAGGLWPTFAKRWKELEGAFLNECGGKPPPQCGIWPDCPKAAALMKEINKEARAADKSGTVYVDLGGGVSMSFGKR